MTGHSATEYEARKRSFLNTEEECRQQGILFVPLVAESSGGWGASALATFRRMAKLASGRDGQSSPKQAALPRLLERLSVSIRSAKARAVLRRAGADFSAAHLVVESAEEVLTSGVIPGFLRVGCPVVTPCAGAWWPLGFSVLMATRRGTVSYTHLTLPTICSV